MAKNGFKPKVSWPYPNILTIPPLQTKNKKTKNPGFKNAKRQIMRCNNMV